MNCFDFHTHRHADNALINCKPADFAPEPGRYYTLGIHPWDAVLPQDDNWQLLNQQAIHPQVKAIGETGLDRLAEGNLQQQAELFCRQAELADELGKTLIVHSVRTSSELIHLHKLLKPHVAWVVHGFRGKPTLAETYLNAGFFLSYGARYQKEALLATPLNRLLLETDESTTPIAQIYQQVAADLSIPVELLQKQIATNVHALIGTCD